MMQRGLAAILGLGALLAVTIALELSGGVADDGGVMISTPRPDSVMPSRPATPPVANDDLQALTDGILARPLFSSTRRPAADAPSGPAPSPASLPRLTGIMVHGVARSAIFAATGGGRPVVVQAGGQVGGYTVQSIDAGQVTLGGPGGSQVLRPTFDAHPQSAANGAGVNVPGAVPVAKAAAPFATATDVMQSLRGLPGFSGAAR